MGEIGLRYRPAAQADLEAHAERLRILTEDVSDVPPSLLERAARDWAMSNKWMPTAAELIELARGYVAIGAGRYRMEGETLEQRANWRILHEPDEQGKERIRRDVHWLEGGGLASGAPTDADCFPGRVFKGRWE